MSKVFTMMNKFIAVAFVDALNTRNTEALADLMVASCRVQNQLIKHLPNYTIHINQILCDCETVVLIGEAQHGYGTIPAVWTAHLCGQKIVDWQVYMDGHISCAN